jgi:hypothetical protein
MLVHVWWAGRCCESELGASGFQNTSYVGTTMQFCRIFHSALTTPSAKTWMRSSYLRSGTVCHLSNLFLLDNESPQQLALTAVKQSNIASRFLFLRDAPAIRERYFKVCFRVRLPRNRMGMENAAPLVGDNLYVCQSLAQM